MSLFDPFADLTQLRRQINRLLDDSGSAAGAQRSAEGSGVWRPAVDVFEDEDALTVKLDLPGIDRATLDVELAEDELRIRGDRKWVKPARGACVHSERPHGQFHRAFRVGIPLQHDQVQASYQDGVLSVRLPKAETLKPRKIAVTVDADEGQGSTGAHDGAGNGALGAPSRNGAVEHAAA